MGAGVKWPRHPWQLGGSDERPERPSLLVALRALHLARRGPPHELDVPAPRPFPGRKPAEVPGQLELGELEPPRAGRSRRARPP